MNKKGAELSLNVIIVAVLVLIVLVVLIVIFSGRIGKFNEGTQACPGKCADDIAKCKLDVGYRLENCKGTDNNVGTVCCPSGLK